MSRLPGVPPDNVRDQPSTADPGPEAGLPSRPRVRLRSGVMRQHLLIAEGPEGTWRCPG
jgi:hypothetical protein